MQVFINMSALSADNGAVAPGRIFHDLAKLLNVDPEYGQYWGQDSLDVSEQDWPLVKELLDDAKMLYRVQGLHQEWQNILTDEVRRHFPAAVA